MIKLRHVTKIQGLTIYIKYPESTFDDKTKKPPTIQCRSPSKENDEFANQPMAFAKRDS